MRIGRRAGGLKAGDPFLALSLSIPGRLPALRWGGKRILPYLPACLPRRDKRGDQASQACRRATCTHPPTTNNSHASISPAIARRQLCCAVPCCDVMWLHPLLHCPSFNGAGLLAADPASRHTAPFLAQALFAPLPPALLPVLPSIEPESASERASSARR